MTGKKILLVDDEPRILRFLSTTLTLEEYEVQATADGESALQAFAENPPDVILLDLGLPDIDGFKILEIVRAESIVPVIILTARDEEKDKVRGLELGADDYLTKPFGTRELLARIQAVLRRSEWHPKPSEAPEFKLRDLTIDFRAHRVLVREEQVHLTPTEYDLLRVMCQNSGQVLTHNDLLENVWGEEYRNDLAILRVNISRLRQKIEVDPKLPEYVLTVPGVGYTIAEA